MTTLVVGDLADAPVAEDIAWRLYQHCFRPVNTLAAQRHLMTRAEFDVVMADKRIRKYLAFGDDDALIGMSTYTNDLDAWPLISSAYFADHWPDHYAAKRIWYCGFVGVRGAGTGVFDTLIKAMYQVAADDGGIISLDICRHNESRGLPEVIEGRLRALAGDVAATPVDAQTFWLYEFPTTVRSAA